MESFGRKEEILVPEVVRTMFGTKEEAEAFVKEFWSAMSFGKEILVTVQNSGDNWSQELTMGDRTTIRRGMGADRGKWTVHVRGNHQPLSAEAAAWLKEKGIF